MAESRIDRELPINVLKGDTLSMDWRIAMYEANYGARWHWCRYQIRRVQMPPFGIWFWAAQRRRSR